MRTKLVFPVLLILLIFGFAASANSRVKYLYINAYSYTNPSGTNFLLVFGVDGTGKVPGSIARIKITAPDGTIFDIDTSNPVLPSGARVTYNVYWKIFDFWAPAIDFIGDTVPSGSYKITVWDKAGSSLTVRDWVNVNPLDVPTNLSPTAGEYVGTTTPTLCWDKVTRAERYLVRIISSNGDTTTPLYYVFTNRRCVTVPNWILRPDREYLWWIDAWDRYDDPQNRSNSYIQNFFTGVAP